jgi:hypothetical protein
MPLQCCHGAMMMCSFGTTPSALVVLPLNKTKTNMVFDANIMDHIPMTNIMPFGMCMAPTNPQVAAATTAALGVLTPQPCVPATTTPWVAGAPTVMLGMQPTLDNISVLNCMWLGVITFTSAGETTVMVP